MNKNTNIIIDWFNKGKNEEDVYNKLISLWISFNAFYFNKTKDEDGKNIPSYVNFLNEENDSDTKKLMFHAKEYQELFNQFIKNNKDLESFHKNIKERDHPGFNKSNGGVIDLNDSKRKVIRYNDINDSKGFIKVVSQVRNNIIHGGKTLELESNYKLVSITSNILYLYLEFIYIDDEIIKRA